MHRDCNDLGRHILVVKKDIEACSWEKQHEGGDAQNCEKGTFLEALAADEGNCLVDETGNTRLDTARRGGFIVVVDHVSLMVIEARDVGSVREDGIVEKVEMVSPRVRTLKAERSHAASMHVGQQPWLENGRLSRRWCE